MLDNLVLTMSWSPLILPFVLAAMLSGRATTHSMTLLPSLGATVWAQHSKLPLTL